MQINKKTSANVKSKAAPPARFRQVSISPENETQLVVLIKTPERLASSFFYILANQLKLNTSR